MWETALNITLPTAATNTVARGIKEQSLNTSCVYVFDSEL